MAQRTGKWRRGDELPPAEARLRAAFGDRTGAVALYHELAALTPEEETARRMFYEMRAAELGAKALGAQGSGPEEGEVTG